MNDSAPPEVRLEFSTASEPQAVGQARRALAALEEFHSDDQVAADVRLLVSELVSNAVTHGSQRQREVELVAGVHHHTLRVEVFDGGPGFTLGEGQSQPNPEAPSGRGLYLLRRLADRYGVDDANEGGKVWFEIDLGPTTRSG